MAGKWGLPVGFNSGGRETGPTAPAMVAHRRGDLSDCI